MFSFINTRIWLYQNPVDFRKQIDGLILLLADKLQQNPISSQLFLFRNQRSNKIKLLIWENNGIWLMYKRLEKGKFKFPEIKDVQCELTSTQLSWLLSGLDISKHPVQPDIKAVHFF